MPAVAPVPALPFWGHDDDADPLAGGELYSFAAGTDTPLSTYQDPAGTVLNANPVVLDDAGYGHIYLSTGVAYKLRLEDRNGVQQWEVDHVYGTGGGGSGAAGVGWGKNTVLLRPAPGSAQAAVAVFPLDTLALGLTAWCDEAFGVSQGLQQIGLGTPALPDCWGVRPPMAAGAASTGGMFLAYGGQPMPTAGMVTLTAYGGLFDGTGQVLVTGHFLTLTAGQEVGLSYTPGTPTGDMVVPPQPPATETQPGLVELIDVTEVLADTDMTRAVTIGRLVSRTSTETRLGLTRYGTVAETTPGTLTTVATHPAGVRAALDGRVPAGAPLSVARYGASGLTLEGTPVTIDATGQVGIGTTTPTAPLTVLRDGTLAGITSDSYQTGTGGANLQFTKTYGTVAAPALVPAGANIGGIAAVAYVRNAGDTAAALTTMARQAHEVDVVDAQGRAGGRWRLLLAPGVSAAAAEVLRVTAAGWLGLGTTGPTARLDVNDTTLRLRTARTPASAAAAGNQGDICWDANFLYVCVNTNVWRRVAHASW